MDLFKKLRLDDSLRILIINAPKEYKILLGDLAYDQRPGAKKTGAYDFVQVFATRQKELETIVKSTEGVGKYDCIYWACYPKGTGSIESDIKRETVWKALHLINLRPVSQVAIDETWSALRGRPGAIGENSI